MSTQSTEKRCYYEVLELPRSCTSDEIRSAYKKLALQRHPDKLIQSGLSAANATASFQELRHAYDVLSDPKERSWYDSHRSQILFTSPNPNNKNDNLDDIFLNLFSYFSPTCYTNYTDERKGFYKVYSEVFIRIYLNEVNHCRKLGLGLGLVKEAPLMGDLDSVYSQVTSFYGYWLGFSTVMDFGWVDKWDVMAGENRKVRRVMEEENKKLRKKAKREFNETVRGLAEFVKKRDKRVVDMMVKKEKEREKKREDEVRRRKEMDREKAERARRYEEPDWAKVDVEEALIEEEEKRDLYCAACGKKFKSDKQWKNHEQSKKHKEKVAELRKSFVVEDDEFEDVDQELDAEHGESEGKGEVEVQDDMEGDFESKDDGTRDGFVSAEDEVVELEEKFRESVGVEEEGSEDEAHKDGDVVAANAEERNGIEQSADGSDEEVSILEAMVSGSRRGRHRNLKDQSFKKNVVKSDDEMEPMEYNNKKGKKKSRRAKKDKGKVSEPEAATTDANDRGEETDEPSSSNAANDEASYDTQANTKVAKKYGDRKGISKQDAEPRPKNSTKGRKQNDKSKHSDPVCEKCGEEFESRNKLYKHISETGHASLKSR